MLIETTEKEKLAHRPRLNTQNYRDDWKVSRVTGRGQGDPDG